LTPNKTGWRCLGRRHPVSYPVPVRPPASRTTTYQNWRYDLSTDPCVKDWPTRGLVLVDSRAELRELLGVLDRDGAGRRRRTTRVLVLVAQVEEDSDDVVPVGGAGQGLDDAGIRAGVVHPTRLVCEGHLRGLVAGSHVLAEGLTGDRDRAVGGDPAVRSTVPAAPSTAPLAERARLRWATTIAARMARTSSLIFRPILSISRSD